MCWAAGVLLAGFKAPPHACRRTEGGFEVGSGLNRAESVLILMGFRVLLAKAKQAEVRRRVVG